MYALMFLLTVIVCFVLIEYGFSKYYYSDTNYISYKQFDAELGWVNKPGTYFLKPRHSFKKVEISIDKNGLRNKNLLMNDKGTMNQIIVLGDSFTFASSIQENFILTSQLENILNNGSVVDYHVVNAGVEGYGNVQELLFMRRLASKEIKGNSYVLMLFINDILDDLCLSYDNRVDNLVQPKYVLGNDKLVLSRPPIKILNTTGNLVPINNKAGTFYTIETIKIMLKSVAQTYPKVVQFINKFGVDIQFPRVPGLINGWYDNNILNDGLPIMKESIKEMKEEAEGYKAKLYVCLIPSPLQVYPDTYGPLLKKTFPDNKHVDDWLKNTSVPQYHIRKICDELNVPFLDLLPVLYGNNNKNYFIPNEGHFNENGHALVAKQLAIFLRHN